MYFCLVIMHHKILFFYLIAKVLFLKKRGFHPTMSGKGACWDNAVVERFFGSLKNEWLLKIYHLTREAMKQDVQHYIRYYNQTRLHSANGGLSPIDFELSLLKVSGLA